LKGYYTDRKASDKDNQEKGPVLISLIGSFDFISDYFYTGSNYLLIL
jgi:hypothetical protein